MDCCRSDHLQNINCYSSSFFHDSSPSIQSEHNRSDQIETEKDQHIITVIRYNVAEHLFTLIFDADK